MLTAGGGGDELALALRTLRLWRRPRGLTLRQGATILGVTPRYLELLEAGQAPLWPEIGHRVLHAYLATERDRALVTVALATHAALAQWMADQAAGGPTPTA